MTSLIVDQQAALYGSGCRTKGEAKITFGTGAFALCVTGPTLVRAQDSGLLPTVAWRKEGAAATYALDGGVLSAAAAVNWARGLGLFDSFAEIDHFDQPAAIDRGLVFLPALSGLGCPHWDRQARGAWMGLGLDHTSSDMMQALLEGIALRASEVLWAMQDGVEPGASITVDGGLTRNSYFLQFLADCLGRDVLCADEREITALGTARLAAEAIGADLDTSLRPKTVSPKADMSKRRDRYAKAVGLIRDW